MKRALRVVGALAIVGGFVAAVLGDQLDWPSASRFVVGLVSVVSLLVGLCYLALRRLSEADRATPADVEPGYRVPVPGDRFDRIVAEGTSTRSVERRLTDRVQVSLLERGLSREEAERVVERGTWTDDRVAAAFLASDDRSVPLTTRLWWWLRGESRIERSVARTVAALAAIREESSSE